MRSLRARLFLAILGVVLLAVGASLALGVVLTRDAVQETLRSNAEQRIQSRPSPRFRPPPPPPPPPVDVLSGDFRRYLAALLIASGAAALLAAAVAALLTRRLTRPLRELGTAAGELAEGRHPEPVSGGDTEELDDLAESFNRMAGQLALARDAERAVLLSVSHDLRTPLTSIRGYAEGIGDGTVEPREAAVVVGREAERLERLVGDLLALARLRQGVLEVRSEPVDLAAVAREAEERLRPQAAEAGVRVAVEGNDARATADHGRALQVVSNLLENAIRVSPEGAAVTIAATPGEVHVSDEGPGIPPEDIPRAFERFHLRARGGHASPGGAGLGLAIVRELTEAMGGSVEVENLPARGARFTVRLPG
jgi:two-component system sensor histidine kinase BaeS